VFKHLWLASTLMATGLVAVTTLTMSPAQADSFQDWANVSAGDSHTCGVRSNGKLYCWGADYAGQVGDGSNDGDGAPYPRRIGAFEDWSAVSAGGSHTCGIRHGGKLYCWGGDYTGQIGNGNGYDSNVISPKRIGSLEDWSNVSAGRLHTCGVRKNGKLYCWGMDINGQVGDGDGSSDKSAPVRIGTHEDWSTVDAGSDHTCGVRTNGKLYCWGWDNLGQVGDGNGGSDTRVTAPRRIGTLEDWSKVSTGAIHSCGIRHGGKLYCWGNDGNGQIGDGGSDKDKSAPVRVGTFEDWSNVSAGIIHTCGIRTNGRLYCWGNDSKGQLGDGFLQHDGATGPRRIGTFEDWSKVSAGAAHTCGVRKNGKLYCWGSDDEAQIGNGEDETGTVFSPERI
jgi:alpha-tubulin suppressor-like RCC1 family protein